MGDGALIDGEAAVFLSLVAGWCIYRGLTYDRKKHGSTRILGWETSGIAAVMGFFQEFLKPRPAYLIAGAVFAVPVLGYAWAALQRL